MSARVDLTQIEARTSRSAALTDSAAEVLSTVAAETLFTAHLVVLEHAKGLRVFDVDGNSYLDMVMGFGPHVLGHAPDARRARTVL
jgi:glutamate-1-semialdehyde aminotransferase